MRRLRINNPDLTKLEKSYLSSAYTTGSTNLAILNSGAFAVNNFAVVGEPSKDEVIELKRISAIPDAADLTLASTLSFNYPKDTVVYQSPWDQMQIESAPASGGTFSVISTSNIQWDKLWTLYVDNSGTDTTQYRWKFINSATLASSEYSVTLTGAGFTPDMVGYILREVRLTTGDLDGRVKKDREIIRDIDRAQEIIYGRVPNLWTLRFEDRGTITTVNTQDKYNLDLLLGGVAGSPAISLGRIESIRYRYSNGSATDITYHLEYMNALEFDEMKRNNLLPTQDYLMNYTLDDPDSSSINGYFRVWPTPFNQFSGSFYIRGYQKPTPIISVDQKVFSPLPSIIMDYCISQIERVRGNDAKADYYEELFFGPTSSQQGNRKLTGIMLLEQLNLQQRLPQGQPRSLMKFRGRKAMSNLFGNRTITRDYIKENYF